MANGTPTTEVVFIDFQTDLSGLQSATDILQRTGQIDAKAAESFKKTNAEITKRTKAINDSAKAVTDAAKKEMVSIEEVHAIVNKMLEDFAIGMQEGVVDALKEAGFEFDSLGGIIAKNFKKGTDGADSFNKKLNEVKRLSPFDSLNKQLADSRKKVLDITAELSRLSKTGGSDTERFKNLTKDLVSAKAEAEKLKTEVDAVNASLEDVGNPDAEESLKKRLLEIKNRMLELKVAGKDNTQEFRDLTKEAGKLTDALGNVNKEIRLAANSERSLTGLLELLGGAAAGFSLITSTQALFGEGSEELQEVLLKVNAAMAALQAIEALVAITKKESAAAALLENIQTKIRNAQLIVENALLSQSIVVRTGAAIAQKALNAAMAANPIGIVAVALAGLIALLATYGRSAALARQQTSSLNVALSGAADAFEAREAAIRRQGDAIIDALENEGAVGSRIAQQEIENQKLAADARRERLQELQQLQRETTKADLEQRQKLQDEIRKLQDEEITDRLEANNLQRRLDVQLRKEQLQAVADNLEARLAGARKNSAQELALSKQLARARADVETNEAGQDANRQKLIRANLLKELRALDLAYQRVRQEDRIAGLEATLAKEEQSSKAINERVSQTEIDLQKKLIQEKARLELLQEGLTANQRLNIIQQSLSAQAELQRNFNATVTRETLEDLISRNNTELQQVNITNAQRLAATEENIIAQAQIEIDAAHGLADRIKEIEAKRNADIRAARRANIEEQLQYELDTADARNGVLRRANERVLSNDRSTYKQRIAAMNQLAALEIASINARQDALDEQLRQGLISQQDYNLKYAQLKDQELAVFEQIEQAKADAAKRRRNEQVNIALQVSQQIVDIVRQAGEQELEEQQQIIDAQRQEIEDLLETGAITEKEAERRQKKLDLEERRLRRQQAQREKDFATFKAALAIPQAYLQGLVQGGPILGAIYAALAAAQAILIATKQPPKFAVGKKHLYEGPAEIGHGGELWQTAEGMHYAAKPTVVWVNKHDKVFSPTETQRMLNKPALQVASYSNVNNNGAQGIAIDYEKLGAEVGKNIPKVGFNFDADGFTVYQQGKNSFDKYLGQRRGY